MESDLKTLLGKRKLKDAVPALVAIGVKGLETLEIMEDADIDEMMEKHKLPKMTGRLLKKELPSLVPALVQKRKEEEEERKRKKEEQKRKEDILKIIPRDASDRLKQAIGDIVHNKVKELYLYSNNISDEGAKALAEALKVNTALHRLDLYSNKISDEGAKALAEVLKVNTALRALHLAYNNISDEGAKALTESLKVNKALQELYLHSNNISDAVKQQIVRELKKNCLETITVDCNKKPSVSDEILAEMEKVIISEAQKGNKIGTVRTYLVAYRKQAGVPESFRFPTGWVTNIHKEHFVEKPNDSPVKL